jgi:hypothetical protein
MEKYEYRTVYTDAKGILGGKVEQMDFERQLNELGEFGWELVNVIPSAQSNGHTRWLISVFKRKRSD